MTVTVFTPSYNRDGFIDNLYRSLQRQTSKDFEWLIVDDGSTDCTEELIKTWQEEEKSFPIRYYKKENGGKCSALNFGVRLAKGLLFFTVDSDDFLTDDAVQKIIVWEKSLPKDGNLNFCGVVGNLGLSESQTPNRSVGKPFRDASLLSRYEEYTDAVIDGERAYAFYTEVQKNYQYPIFDGEKFMTEAVSWNRMARDGYLARFFDDIICIYEYQPDGLTANVTDNYIKCPKGHGLWLKEKAQYCGYSFKKRMAMYYSFCCDHNALTIKQAAEYIGAPCIIMGIFYMIRKIAGMFGRNI